MRPTPLCFPCDGGKLSLRRTRSQSPLSTSPTSLLVPDCCCIARPTSAISTLRPRSRALHRRLPPRSPSRSSFDHWRASSGGFLCAMRIRKGHRCSLSMALADRSSLREGLVLGEKNARVVADDKKGTSPETVSVCAAADTSRGSQDQLQDLAKSTTSSSGTERLEVDRGKERLSSDEEAEKHNPVERRISLSSIIPASAASARNNLPPAPASHVQAVVASDTSVVRQGTEGCSPCVATKSMDDDEPAALLQSLRRVCSAAASTGLTAKEAVGKIRELCLPGLNEGGERLIVQVARAFRSSLSFVEHEERGRYFVQEYVPSLKLQWGYLDTNKSKANHEMGSVSRSAIPEVVEAATQLLSLRVRSAWGDVEKNRAGGKTAVTGEGSKSGGSASSSEKASASWGNDEPRCNREDGKGWRCFRPAEVWFSTQCKYHRDQMGRARLRRMSKSNNKLTEQSPVVRLPLKRSIPRGSDVEKEARFRGGTEAEESDEEVPQRKLRRFVKAKSLKTIM